MKRARRRAGGARRHAFEARPEARRRAPEEVVIEWGRLLRCIARAPGPITVPGLVRLLDLEVAAEPALRRQVEFLEKEGILFAQRRGRYQMHGRAHAVAGRLSIPRGSFGFVASSDGPDLFIPPSGMRGARHGDHVLARVVSARQRHGPDSGEGAVVAVLRRAAALVPARYDAARGLVIPRDERIARVILTGRHGETPDGAIVWAEVTRPEDRFSPAEGRIAEVEGDPAEPGVAERTILRMLAIPEGFSPEALHEAAAIEKGGRATARGAREDFTGQCVFTIDPDDAKDHDDAVALETIDAPGGPVLRLSVHIADVSHYVSEGSGVDRDAARRGVSVYLPGRCLPMLPEPLSSSICSLVPGQDRLVQSAIIDFAQDGRRLSVRFAEGVIRSRARLTYRGAAAMLQGSSAGNPELLPSLRAMDRLAGVLRRRRMRRGSLDLTTPDIEVAVDLAGRPISVQPADRSETYGLIEEFMLAANEAVASYFVRRRLPVLWRVHEEPDPRRLADLETALRVLGVTMPAPGAAPAARLKALLAQARGRPEEEAIGMMALRALKLARYTHEHGGHFGLASDAYLHFTSPIRRYADLVVHRLLRTALRMERAGEEAAGSSKESLLERLATLGEECSALSRRAEEAERAVKDWKIALWMAGHMAAEAIGRVTGRVTPGFLVTLEGSGVEGLVPVRGERDATRYRLGERLRVRVVSTDPLRGRVALKVLSRT